MIGLRSSTSAKIIISRKAQITSRVRFLFHLLFVDDEFPEMMERVDKYNKRYGPKDFCSETSRYHQPRYQFTTDPDNINHVTTNLITTKPVTTDSVTTNRITTDPITTNPITTNRPIDKNLRAKADAIPERFEGGEGEARTPLWMVAVFLMGLLLAIRGRLPASFTYCCTRTVESPHPWVVGGSYYPSRGRKSTGRVKNQRVGWVKSMGKGDRELFRGMK